MSDDGGLARDKTLRDEFAGRAMAGMIGVFLLALSAKLNESHNVDITAESFAMVRSAYGTADAMIAEKRKREGACP